MDQASSIGMLPLGETVCPYVFCIHQCKCVVYLLHVLHHANHYEKYILSNMHTYMKHFCYFPTHDFILFMKTSFLL